MTLNNLLTEQNMTKYQLSKKSGVPQTTVIDICSGKTRLEKCTAETVYRIAQALGVSMESLLQERMEKTAERRSSSSARVGKPGNPPSISKAMVSRSAFIS